MGGKGGKADYNGDVKCGPTDCAADALAVSGLDSQCVIFAFVSLGKFVYVFFESSSHSFFNNGSFRVPC